MTAPLINTIEFFNSLPGAWSFRRSITNNINPDLSGVVAGKACFTQVHEFELKYTEAGMFKLVNNNLIKITNEYFFVYDTNEKQLEKYFALNGKKHSLFYRLKNKNSATHLCSDDIYHANYISQQPGCFSLIYQVQGPAKNYISTTIYSQIA